MHAHDYRSRQCQLPNAPPVIPIARHCCAREECGARWQTLPAFVARHLHFNWPKIDDACEASTPKPSAGRRPSPKTIGRWIDRLSSSAAQLVRLLTDAGRSVPVVVRTRGDLVAALGIPFEALAAWLHALMPGVRLM
jgi:hypothetical protein